jgi:hypothetical protein
MVEIFSSLPPVICPQHLDYMSSSYSVYYIDLTLLFVLIRHFKREFLLAMFNDMFDCDEVSYCFFLLQSLSIHFIGSVYLHNSESVFQNSNN